MPALDDPVSAPPGDGRSARAVRTRNAIVDACISLADDGDLKPTTPRIAERAGVSVRSVFQHFDTLESLYAAVAERVVQRSSRLILPIDPSLPLGERVEEMVRQRSLLLEVMTPIRRASALHAPFSETLTMRIRAGQDFFRAFTADAFQPELSRLDGAEGSELLDILNVVLGWSTWETLRSVNGRSVEEATRTVDKMLRGALRAAGFEVAPPS